jgi:hypothetical protein
VDCLTPSLCSALSNRGAGSRCSRARAFTGGSPCQGRTCRPRRIAPRYTAGEGSKECADNRRRAVLQACSLGAMPTPLLVARVDPELVAELDALAAREGETRSALVRRAIADLVARDNKAGE